MYKFLKIIFVLLLIVTIGEAGYYLYVFSGRKTNKTDTASITDANLPITPTITGFQYDPDIFTHLASRTLKPNQKVTVNSEFMGIVKEVKHDIDYRNVKVDLYLSLTSDSNDAKYWLKKDNTNVYRITQNVQKQPAALTDIKQGDKLNVIQIIGIKDFKNKDYEYTYEIDLLSS